MVLRIVPALFAVCALFAQQPAENDLQTAIALTRQGQFQQAIPHFLAARGHVADEFAVEFNLALCYVGTRQFPRAIGILTSIGEGRRHAADVDNLLAQAFVGDHQQEAAMQAFQRSADAAPANEKLYLLVSEACFDEGLADLGIRVLGVGLRNLPDSPRLLFERGLLRSQLEQTDLADADFQSVRKLAPDSDIAYVAAAQQALLAGNVQQAIRAAREGIGKGHPHYVLLTMLGEALLRAGATPATPIEFAEAQAALERAVEERPGYSSAHIALGRIYLARQKVDDAIAQLEAGRQLDPRNRAVYAALATAWRRAGNPDKAREALARLAELNREEAARVGSADGGHAGYVAAPPR